MNFNVSGLVKGDVVFYYHHENGSFYIESGTLAEDNIYEQGVEVHGDGWKQHVGKWFINKVERNGVVIYQNEDLKWEVEES